jgi:lipopolysaccharide transport system permease protein
MFYPIEVVPSQVQFIFTLNPVYCAMSCFRQCVYGTIPDFSMILYLGAFAFTTLGIGLLLFSIFDKRLALEL